MSSNKNRRRRLLADSRVQGMLCLRIAIYWITCQAFTFGTVAVFSVLAGPGTENDSITNYMVPAFCFSTLVLPLILLDALVFSNRFVGPVWNLRKHLKALVNEGSCEEVRFRGGDYYRDLHDNFNKLVCALRESSRNPALPAADDRNETPTKQAVEV